jgi:VWFA-related protein
MRRAFCLLATLGFLSQGVLAQSAVSQGVPPVIRVTTHLVQVSVTAVDSRGRPVSKLTPDDFKIEDEGVPQAIRFFVEESGAAPHSDTGAEAPVLPPGHFSNRQAVRDIAPLSLTIILFDQLNTTFSDQAFAQKALGEFLQKSPPAGPTAIYLLNGQLLVLRDFSLNRSALTASVSQIKPHEDNARFAATPRPAATGLPSDPFENMIRAREARYFLPERRIRPTLEAFRAIADSLANIPGRKNVIWLSGSFPIAVGMQSTPLIKDFPRDFAVYEEKLSQLARRMSAANIAVYPVDVRGLTTLDLGVEDNVPPISAGLNWPSMGDAGMMGAATSQAVASPDPSFAVTLYEIADWTGGRSFMGSNDLRGELEQAAADGQQYYLLGFYPDVGKWDGKFHYLKVTVLRPGVKVRARKGYFAADEAQLDESGKMLRLQLAESSPLNVSEVALELKAYKHIQNDTTTVHTQLELNPSQLVFRPVGSGWLGTVVLVFLQRGETVQPLSELRRTIEIRLSNAQYEKALKHSLRFSTPLKLAPAAEDLRILIQDASSGSVGSLTIPISTVPSGYGLGENVIR